MVCNCISPAAIAARNSKHTRRPGRTAAKAAASMSCRTASSRRAALPSQLRRTKRVNLHERNDHATSVQPGLHHQDSRRPGHVLDLQCISKRPLRCRCHDRRPAWTWLTGSGNDPLKAYKVPQAFGFVNAARIKEEPDSELVLDAWRQAGYPLGNHTYNHMNLARAPSLEAWKADVLAGEAAISTRMDGEDWRYLRLPNLAAGTHARPALAWLQEQGYRIADVSLSFADSAYKDSYARCLAKGDSAAIDAMKQHYFATVDNSIARMKQDSQRVYGRIIPQVMLAHLGAWGAETLPVVLARLTAAGARFVPLGQAQSDPAYAEPGGGTVIARAAKARGIALGGGHYPAAARLDVGAMCR